VKPYLYMPKTDGSAPPRDQAGAQGYGRAAGCVEASGWSSQTAASPRTGDDATALAARARGLPLAHPGRRRQRGSASAPAPAAAKSSWTRVSIWRSSARRHALAGRRVVDRDGDGYATSQRYGAAIADAIVRRGGRAWLWPNGPRGRAGRPGERVDLWFKAAAGLGNMLAGPMRAPTVAARPAGHARARTDRLEATMARYNAAARDRGADPCGQPAARAAAQDHRSTR